MVPPGTLAPASAPAADLLAIYRRNRRVVLLFADKADDQALRAQQADLGPHAPGLTERDMVVVVSADAALRRQLDAPASGFAAILIGKDGGVKLCRAAPIPFVELAAAVDAMPMRRNEMRLRTR